MSADPAAAAASAPVTGVPDRYRLDEVVGHGGMAEVYRGRDLTLDRDVAVKVLRDSVDDTDRSRFVGEARVLAQLSHPGLVTVLDAGIGAAQPYLVMELVEGPTLSAALRDGPMPLGQAAEIGAQLAATLAYAHDQGVVHRDVKPGNVLLGPEGRVKLADFGIARLIGDTVRHTQTGTTIGTAAYLSPEQVRGDLVGPPTDVYSLGLVLLEGITGERAYPGSPTEAAVARLHRPPDVPDALAPPWRALLTAMTALEPAQRPATAVVAERLRAFADGRTSADPAATAAVPTNGATWVLPPIPSTPPASSPPGPPGPPGPPTAPRPSGPHHVADTGGAGRWVAVRRRLAAVPAHQRGVAVAVGLVLLVLLVIGLAARGTGGTDDPIPSDTPSDLRDPLQELHDAVHGQEP